MTLRPALSLVLGCLLTHLAMAQMPRPCSPPSQISFRARQYQPVFTLMAEYQGQYDAHAQTVYFREIKMADTPNNITQYLEMLVLYREGVVYEFDQSTLKCTTSPSGPWRPWGVPGNATYRDSYTVGDPSVAMGVVEWSYVDYAKRETYIFTSTVSGCYPVMATHFPTDTRDRSVLTFSYDMTLGLTDPSKFIPPGTCAMRKTTAGPLSDKAKHLLNLFKGA